MPIGEEFWNPYRMIPVRSVNGRRPPTLDGTFKGVTGTIRCTLENLSPLYIGRANETSSLKRGDRHLIPGSSLKGMLRSLVEIVGSGCAVTARQGACNKANQLCVGCRMFGMMERGPHARVHTGKVRVGDAVSENSCKTIVLEILLGSPAPKHTSFYVPPMKGRECRKLYFHHPQRQDTVPTVPEKLRNRAKRITAIASGHRFSFELFFQNLEPDEFHLLIYSLALESEVKVAVTGEYKEPLSLQGPMRHKIGMGKPLGMGSAAITIEKVTFTVPPQGSPKARFGSLSPQSGLSLAGQDLQEKIIEWTASQVADQSDTMQYLRKMMVWDPNDPRDFHHPSYDWFKDSKNSQTTLKPI